MQNKTKIQKYKNGRMSGFSQGLQKARKETDRRASAYKDERREDDVPIDEEQKRRASTLLKQYASVKAAEAADIRLVDETLKNISKKTCIQALRNLNIAIPDTINPKSPKFCFLLFFFFFFFALCFGSLCFF